MALVLQGSPAAMGGMKFGDQILQINGENVAGFTAEKVHGIFKKAGVNNIVLAVRDRWVFLKKSYSLSKSWLGLVRINPSEAWFLPVILRQLFQKIFSTFISIRLITKYCNILSYGTTVLKKEHSNDRWPSGKMLDNFDECFY